MFVELTVKECAIARYIGRSRHKINVAKNRHNDQVDEKRDNRKLHVEGMAGELAAAKWLGCYPDLTTDRYPYPKYDMQLDNGLKVDAKASPIHDGHLIVPRKKVVEDCDLYLYLEGEMPRFRVRGWARSDYVIDRANLRPDRPGYWVHHTRLTQADDWPDWVPIQEYMLDTFLRGES